MFDFFLDGMDVEFLNILNTTTPLLNIWKWSYYLQYGGNGMVENNNNCIPHTKYVWGILWFSRRYAAAASAAAASADTSSFSR